MEQEISCTRQNENNCPQSRDPAIGPYLSQMNPVYSATSYFLKIHCNIILSSTLGSPKCSFLFRFDTSDVVYIPHVSCVLHISPSQLYIHFIIVIALTFGGESKLQNCCVC